MPLPQFKYVCGRVNAATAREQLTLIFQSCREHPEHCRSTERYNVMSRIFINQYAMMRTGGNNFTPRLCATERI